MLIINWEIVEKILMVRDFLGKHWVIIGLTLGLGEYWLLIEKSLNLINVLSIFDQNTRGQRAPLSRANASITGVLARKDKCDVRIARG